MGNAGLNAMGGPVKATGDASNPMGLYGGTGPAAAAKPGAGANGSPLPDLGKYKSDGGLGKFGGGGLGGGYGRH